MSETASSEGAQPAGRQRMGKTGRAAERGFCGDHRPWPAPDRPWAMVQTWRDLLFAHWPVPKAMIEASVPRTLDVDTFDGEAWVGVVPFRMSDIQLRRLPISVPWLSGFPELNVRTYVTAAGGAKPGVLFYTLEADNPVAVAIARRWYHLPYRYARMRCRRSGNSISYASHRMHPGAPAADFSGRYRPIGPVFTAVPGSIEDWLTARYCLYTHDTHGRSYRGEIDHAPWPLQPAEAELRFDSLTTPHGIKLPGSAPLLHFARRLQIRAWTIEPVEDDT